MKNAQKKTYIESIKPKGRTTKSTKNTIPRLPNNVDTNVLYNMTIKTQPIKIKQLTMPELNLIPQISCQRIIDNQRKKKVLSYYNSDKYSHLTARCVSAAELPNKQLYIIDGNTRIAVWYDEMLLSYESGVASNIDIPEIINVFIYPVKDMQEAELLYFTFDNKNAHETADDKIGGACESLNLTFTNPTLTRRKWKMMLVEIGNITNNTIEDDISEERAYIRFFKQELLLIDKHSEFKNALGSEIVGILIGMLYKERGNTDGIYKILEFFNHVGCGTGDYAANGAKNGVAFLHAEYDKNNMARRYQHKSTYRKQMFALWTIYYKQWHDNDLRKKRCIFTDKTLLKITNSYFLSE